MQETVKRNGSTQWVITFGMLLVAAISFCVYGLEDHKNLDGHPAMRERVKHLEVGYFRLEDLILDQAKKIDYIYKRARNDEGVQ